MKIKKGISQHFLIKYIFRSNVEIDTKQNRDRLRINVSRAYIINCFIALRDASIILERILKSRNTNVP